MRNIDFIRDVKKLAENHWPDLLQRLGIAVPDSPRKHAPCPACGGRDRFRFDDEGRGLHICNQCSAGDGLDLIQKVKGCDVIEAAKLAAGAMAMPLPEHSAKERVGADKPIAEKVAALMARTHLGESLYLNNKGLQGPHSLLADGSLALVLRTLDGTITGAQVIHPSGKKRYLSGSRKRGAFISVGDIPERVDTVLITEGYATALSVASLEGGLVLAALDANNLLPVAQTVRQRWSEAEIIIAADNDMAPDGPNVGKEAAEKAALAVSGFIALPPTDHKADWDDYHRAHGLEVFQRDFVDGVTLPKQPSKELDREKTQNKEKNVSVQLHAIEGGKARRRSRDLDLAQMAASQRGAVLAERYGSIVVHPESETVYTYNGTIWEKVPDCELRREMVVVFNENETPYSPKGVNAAIDAMKLQIPAIGQQRGGIIGFANGVYNLATGQFSNHCPDNWLMNHNGIIFTPASPSENLKDHAPHFHRWITYAAGNNLKKVERIKAALFMVLANRYDWQLFVEVTGEGGSGKSIFTTIATLLTGEHNMASGNMAALDSARGRAQFIGKRLILLPDQPKYVGEGTGIKAITGGDPVEIDGKYEKQFTTVLPAVVLATNNEPMTFTERNGGIARRRVIFAFNIPVKDADKDPDLAQKISTELPVIIRHLLDVFTDQNKAKQLIIEQRGSVEALEVKRGTDPVIDLCAALYFMSEPKGLMMGGGTWAGQPEPRKYLYHLYLAFLEYHGLGKPLAVNKFSKALKNAAKEYQREYITRLIKGRTQTNIELNDLTDEFLPRAYGVERPQ